MLKDTFTFLIQRHQEKMLPTLLTDMREDQLADQPIAGMNHPAWILGHLLTFEHRIAGDIMHRPLQVSLDADWLEVYGIGSTPKSQRRLYKSREFYMTALQETAAQIAAYIAEKSDADLEAPNPDPQFSSALPTMAKLLGAAVTHRAYHSGQLAIWRKAMGLPHVGM